MTGRPKDTTKRECTHPHLNHQHGTRQAYVMDRCRCDDCRTYRTEDARKQRTRSLHRAWNVAPEWLVDATGTHRRIQALQVLGWSSGTLGARLGITYQGFQQFLTVPRVTRETAAKVVALYDELWDQQPPETCKPERIAAAKTRNYARRQGWVPPLAWDDDELDDPAARPHVTPQPQMPTVDEVKIQRRIDGQLVELTKPEMHEAHRRLEARGWSAKQIAAKLGITARTVHRKRAA